MSQDIEEQLRDGVCHAYAEGTPLCIRGSGSKDFLGGTPRGTPLSTYGHQGIIDYAPVELVVSVRAGTTLHELEQTLADAGQMLGFEPPRFGTDATIGGTVACALAGPRRAFAGGVRDALLGCRILNGCGEVMHFGGRVMKNVAGYDVARLMAGAMGTLGVLLDVSLRVLPCPETTLTLRQEYDQKTAIRHMRELCRRPLPLSGLCHDGTALYLRLAGTAAGVASAREQLGGDTVDNDPWRDIREQRHPFFTDTRTLWRLDMAPATPLPDWGEWLIDWGGNLRWLKTDRAAQDIHRHAAEHGGQARLFRRAQDMAGEDYTALPSAALRALHRRLKAAFDPKAILNPGRLYPED
ncbi:MAG TPA: glycolate oxidase subunit GlcE [Gammaproteobacteria bacterium]|nr:glycolate oxidase subunit GlcE [Gammaproteobacteria bacterium]